MKLVTHVPRDRPDRSRPGAVVGTAAGALTLVDLRAAVEATEQLNSPSTEQTSSMLGGALAFLRTGEEAVRVAERLLDRVLATASEEVGLRFPLQSVRPLPPVPQPGKAICVGLNCFDHCAEIGRPTFAFPAGFVKLQGTSVDYDCTATRPSQVSRLDYVAELAVVLGRQCKPVLRERAYAAMRATLPSTTWAPGISSSRRWLGGSWCSEKI